MKVVIFVIGLLTFPGAGFAQESSETEKVEAVILSLFEGMRQGDSAMVHTAFLDDARLHTVVTGKDGKSLLREGSLQKFLTAVGTPQEQIWDEPIWDLEVKIDGDLAQAWTQYAFYLGSQFSHCGVDAFQLFRSSKGWKIFQLTDTRRKQGCQVPPEIEKARR